MKKLLLGILFGVSALAAPLVAGAYGQGGYYSEGGYYSQSTYYSQPYYEGSYSPANFVTRFHSTPTRCKNWGFGADVYPSGYCNNDFQASPLAHPYIPANSYNKSGTRYALVFTATTTTEGYGVSSDCRTWGMAGQYENPPSGFAIFTPFVCVNGANAGTSFSVTAGTPVTLAFWNRGKQQIGYNNGCSFQCGDATTYSDQTFLPTCTTNFGASITYNNANATGGRGYGVATVAVPAGTNTYTVSCSGGSPGAHARSIVIVGNAAPSVGPVSGSPNPVAYNGVSTISWTSTQTNSCRLTGGSFGSGAYPAGTSVASAGSLASGAHTAPITYTLTCLSNTTGLQLSSGTTVNVTSAPPVMTTSAASAVTGSTATLNGTGNPSGVTTTGWFRYSTTNPGTCNDTFGTRLPASGGSALGAGGAAVAYSQAVGGLTPGTTYYFCAIGQNAIGFGYGSVLSFATGVSAASVSTNSAGSITTASATLNGTITSTGGANATQHGFARSTDSTLRTGVSTSTLGAKTGTGAFSEAVGSLTTNTTYYFRAYATNAAGTGYGSTVSFTTVAPPGTITGGSNGLQVLCSTNQSAASSCRVRRGDPVTLSWATTNMTTCTVRDQQGTTISSALNSPVGGQSSGAVTGPTIYTLACTDAMGVQSTATAQVNLIPEVI